jgi:hypothetical protein
MAMQALVREMCAGVMATGPRSKALVGSVLSLRQQPASRACAVDVFLWIPQQPNPHVRLRSAGSASSASSASVCQGDVGVLPGSSAMDAARGLVQTEAACARSSEQADAQLYTPGETCPAKCSHLAPARDGLTARSEGARHSAAITEAYADVLDILSDNALSKTGLGPVPITPRSSHSAVDFERLLGLPRSACCSTDVCAESVCVTADAALGAPPPSPPPSTPDEGSDDVDVGVVVGASVGAVVGVALVGAVIYLAYNPGVWTGLKVSLGVKSKADAAAGRPLLASTPVDLRRVSAVRPAPMFKIPAAQPTHGRSKQAARELAHALSMRLPLDRV